MEVPYCAKANRDKALEMIDIRNLGLFYEQLTLLQCDLGKPVWNKID